jgi:hypothetical protein
LGCSLLFQSLPQHSLFQRLLLRVLLPLLGQLSLSLGILPLLLRVLFFLLRQLSVLLGQLLLVDHSLAVRFRALPL